MLAAIVNTHVNPNLINIFSSNNPRFFLVVAVNLAIWLKHCNFPHFLVQWIFAEGELYLPIFLDKFKKIYYVISSKMLCVWEGIGGGDYNSIFSGTIKE